MKELLPCPFCGAAATLEDCRDVWAVRCTDCEACVLGTRAMEPDEEWPPEFWDEIEQSAVDAWNRRAPLCLELA